MVENWIRSLLFIFPLLFLASPCVADVRVTAVVDDATASEGHPLRGKLTVVHEIDSVVDSDSIRLEGKPLAVELVNSTKKQSLVIVNRKRSETITAVDTYVFQLEGKQRGLYALPSIEVTVDGKKYRTKPVTYKVHGTVTTPAFRMKAFVVGTPPFYPGQHLTFTYRIKFRKDIEVTLQQLPLLDAKGFRKIGDKQTRSYLQGKNQVHEVSQEVTAKGTGSHSFPLSFIEGFVYREDFLGRRIYEQPRIRAEAEPISIEVVPFPNRGKPAIFNGAIGAFSMAVTMVTPGEVGVGDKVILKVVISGDGDLTPLRLPDMAQQKGFAGKFRFSDLPPTATMAVGSKTFMVEVRPLSPDVDRIPALSFACFEPFEGRYRLLQSTSIPLVVAALAQPSNEVTAQGSGAPLTNSNEMTVPPPPRRKWLLCR